MQYKKYITRKMLQENPDTLFVFGDNMLGLGYGGQAREMRGERNAVGIPTKNAPGIFPTDYFSDDDFDTVKDKIFAAFKRLVRHIERGGRVVWPLDGIGTGLADLPNKSPKIWNYIEYHRCLLEDLLTK